MRSHRILEICFGRNLPRRSIMHGNTRRGIISTVRVAAGAILRDFRFISCFVYSPALLGSRQLGTTDRSLTTAQRDDKTANKGGGGNPGADAMSVPRLRMFAGHNPPEKSCLAQRPFAALRLCGEFSAVSRLATRAFPEKTRSLVLPLVTRPLVSASVFLSSGRRLEPRCLVRSHFSGAISARKRTTNTTPNQTTS
jgi:hypothetical protein